MRLSLNLLGAALLSAAAAAASTPAHAADHRDAPFVDERPPGDINDVYLFRRSGKIVFAMMVNGVSNKDFNDTYTFGPDALYRFGIDLDGDGSTDSSIDVTFSPVDATRAQEFVVRLPGGGRVRGKTTPPTVLSDDPPAPVVADGPKGVRVFAGQRDDPFYFDVVGFKRFVATGRLKELRGEDSFAGLNVSIIAVEVPVELVSGGKTKLGVSGFTYFLADDIASAKGTPKVRVDGKVYEQFDRMGNPVVNTVFIPGAMKDAFNRGLPENDARDFGATILATLKAFGTPSANVKVLASVAVPDTLKYDLSQPDGYPNGRQPADDVIDTLLSLVVGKKVSDGVDSNDKRFPGTFPYFAPPHQPQGD